MARMTDLRCKEVISLKSGCRLGYVCDLEIDLHCGEILAIIVPGRLKFFGFFGREEDYIIPWKDIERIGDDIILVNCPIREATANYRRNRGRER